MESKKINQLATNLAPLSTDLTIVGDPITGVSKKITLSQIANLFAGSIDFYANLAAFPVTGTINIIYCAKDTQKLYLWSGSAYVETFPSQAVLNTYQLLSAKGVANGYASLDASGKVPIGELPSSIMEYKGLWSAATNTPTLADGTGDTGDVYICSAAGSVNFGAGAITFAVGDYVIYSGTIWQRSSGAVGTVTSVGLSSATSGVTIGSSPVTTSGTITLAIATATTSQNGLLSSTDWTTFNAKQNAITLTTTGTSGASTLVGATLNIPNYGSALTGYVPYTGATANVDLGIYYLTTARLNANEIKATTSAGIDIHSNSGTQVVIFGAGGGAGTTFYGGINGTSASFSSSVTGNTIVKSGGTSSQFLKADGTVDSNTYALDSAVVHNTGSETIGGTKTFSDASKNNGGIFLQNASSNSLAGYMNIGGLTNGVKFTSGGGISNTFTLPSATGYTFTFPNATGTLALTSDISYPVTSVFGRTGAVVATSGDYTTAQVTESGNLYFTDSRARLALSFVAGSGAYNSTTGVITIPTDNSQIANGAGYITSSALSGYLPLTGGTLTGALGGTSAVFSSSVTATQGKFSGSRPQGIFTENGTSGLYLRDATGTGYKSWSVGTNDIVVGFAITPSTAVGGTTFTTPSFVINESGNVGIGISPLNKFTINTGTNNNIDVFDNGTGIGIQSVNNNNTAYRPLAILGSSLSFTGAATFSSSVTAGGTIIVSKSSNSGSGNDFPRLQVENTLATQGDGSSTFNFADIRIASGNSAVQMFLSTTYAAGTWAPAGILNVASNHDLQLKTNNTTRLTIASTGAATFSSSVTINQSGYTFGAGLNLLNWQFVQGGDNALYLAYSGTQKFSMSSAGAATFSSSVTATSFFESSDSRLKTLIQDNYQTKGIASITPKLYTKNGKVELGYYAQDFVGILDSAVSKGSDDMLSLSYREVLVAKVYALEQRIKELETK